ncbi:MAG: site-specific integrase [Candidatus Bathyarchaeia archaeon]
MIAACEPKTATFLQLLKETGIRAGEAIMLKRTDVDFTNRTVRITPEKGSEPRVFKLSNKLMELLLNVRERSRSNRVFCKNLHTIQRLFWRTRKRLAEKLKNTKFLQMHLHTFRHWKATMEYAKTKDILHVMRLLGHKRIQNTLIYTQLIDFREEEYVSKVARTVEEACKLIEEV